MKLKGHVIIVDEAHNIEDQCRDAASLQLDQTNINLAKMDCEKVSKFGTNSTSYAALVSILIYYLLSKFLIYFHLNLNYV